MRGHREVTLPTIHIQYAQSAEGAGFLFQPHRNMAAIDDTGYYDDDHGGREDWLVRFVEESEELRPPLREEKLLPTGFPPTLYLDR